MSDSDLEKLREFYITEGFDLEGMSKGDFEGQVESIEHPQSIELPVPPVESNVGDSGEICAEVEKNNERISELLDREIKTDWFGDIHEQDLARREHEVLILMARNYTLLERVHGNVVVEPVATDEPKTIGEHISMVFYKAASSPDEGLLLV